LPHFIKIFTGIAFAALADYMIRREVNVTKTRKIMHTIGENLNNISLLRGSDIHTYRCLTTIYVDIGPQMKLFMIMWSILY
jgi:hypothetical protein